MTQRSRDLIGGLRRQDWAFFAFMFCAGGTVISASIGDRIAPFVYAAGTLISGALARRWSRLYRRRCRTR